MCKIKKKYCKMYNPSSKNNYQSVIDKNLHEFIANNNFQHMKHLLIYKGANVNSKYNDLLPLQLVILKKAYDVLVQLLKVHQANVNVRCSNYSNSTVMHFVCMLNDGVALGILLNHGDKNYGTIDDQGKTPLHYCAEYGSSVTCAILLQIPDINVNAIDLNGNTALHYACSNSKRQIIQLILMHRNCDIHLRNNVNKHAMECAAESEFAIEILHFFINLIMSRPKFNWELKN